MTTDCAGCAVTMDGLIELQHPDCPVHKGEYRCPEHGGDSAHYQCRQCIAGRCPAVPEETR